jgi:hypothetical protein
MWFVVGTQFAWTRFLLFCVWGIYPQSVALESHILCYKIRMYRGERWHMVDAKFVNF